MVVRLAVRLASEGGPHRASYPSASGTVRSMQKPRTQIFIVAEGSVVIGSFVTLKDALDFRAKSGSRTARIVADHGDFDKDHRSEGHFEKLWVRGATSN